MLIVFIEVLTDNAEDLVNPSCRAYPCSLLEDAPTERHVFWPPGESIFLYCGNATVSVTLAKRWCDLYHRLEPTKNNLKINKGKPQVRKRVLCLKPGNDDVRND
jgi:hypothetical protein